MKKLVLPVVALLAFSIGCKKSTDTVVTPLVLTQADFATNFKAFGTPYNTFNVNLSATTSLKIPSRGENQVWDFSTLAESSAGSNGGNSFLVPTNIAFPAATFTIPNVLTYSAAGVTSANIASKDFLK
jgi:hypothetical protein